MAFALQLDLSPSTVLSCRSGVTTKQKPIFESPEYALKQRQHHEHMLRQLQPQYHSPSQFHPPSEVLQNCGFSFMPSNRGLQLPSTSSSASSDPPLWSPPSSNLSVEAEQFGLSLDNTTPMQSQSRSKSVAESSSKYPTPGQASRANFQEANSVYGQLVDSPHAGNSTWPFQDPTLPGPYPSYGGVDPNLPLYQFPPSYPPWHPVVSGNASSSSYAQPLLGMDMGMFGSAFRGVDGTSLEVQPEVISTEWLRNSPRNSIPAQAHVPVLSSPNMRLQQQEREREQAEIEAPPSPLRPLSPSVSIESFLSAGAVEASMHIGSSSPKFTRSRPMSDSEVGDSPEPASAAELRSRRPRSHTWMSPVTAVRRKSHTLLGYSREDGQRELEMLEEENGGSLNRQDKRRLQNRIAQRAFRARSKVHHADLAGHMAHLEFLKITQQERITQMSAIIEKQRREILALRKGDRNKRSAVPLPGSRSDDDDGV